MARISVKYPIGEKVTMHEKVPGIITAIFIRGKNTAYECSYVDRDGNPTSVMVEGAEVGPQNPKTEPIGFKT